MYQLLSDENIAIFKIVIQPVLAGLVGAIAGFGISYLKEWVPAKYKWRLCSPEKSKFVIATSAEIDTGHYTRLTTGLGQVLAIGKILPSFLDAYTKKCEAQIQFSSNFTENDYKNDLVIIGGTKNNKVAEYILSKCPNLPYTQKVIDGIDVIIDNRRHHNITGQVADGKVKEDFGLIISIPNPCNSDARAILFLSVHTYGLEAAADAFANKIGFWKNLTKKNYICLVKCTINNSVISPPEILDFLELKL